MIRVCIAIFFATLMPTYQSCGTGKDYSIDKSSPKGTYRIKIEVTSKSGAPSFEQRCKIQYLKGQQEIGGFETRCQQDEYESSLAEGWQVVEWAADNAARIGRDRSDQPFADELLISNKTGEVIKYLGLEYGRFQHFVVFDLPAEGTLTLAASPEFKPDGTSSHSVSYSGDTQTGRVIEGVLTQNQRTSRQAGPYRFEIVIDSHSFRR